MWNLKPFSLLICLILSGLIQAQSGITHSTDKVFTTEGSVFIGQIIEYKQGKYLRLQLKSGDTILLEEASIKKITQKFRHPYQFKDRGFYYHFRISALPGRQRRFNYLIHGYSIAGEFGYQKNLFLGTGIGISADQYCDNATGLTFLPLFLNVRSYFLAQNRTPYIRVNAGYGFTLKKNDEWFDKAKGGLMLETATGIRFGSRRGAFTLDFGIKMQNATLLTQNRHWESWNEIRHLKYWRTSINIGWLF